MPHDLGWYLRRLRAMPPAEIALRTYRAVRHPIDLARMRASRYAVAPASLATWCGPRTFYFDPELSSLPLSATLREHAERLIAGQRHVLGLGWLTLPDPPWHTEPSRGGEWPLVDAARILHRAPSGFDARLTWELNRGHEWVILARAWAGTRDVRFRDQLARELASWERHNPVGFGINWASTMEAAIRIHSFVWVAAFLRGEALGNLAAHIYTHAAFVRRHLSEYSSANNHLIVELSALAVASRALHDRPDTAALARLHAELQRQVFPDGVSAEMATHYHMFVLEALVLVAHLEQRYSAKLTTLDHIIARMADYVASLRCGDGSILHQGDNDDGKILPFFADAHADQLIQAAAALVQQLSQPSPHEGVFWLTNGGSADVRPVTISRCLEQSGQVVMRSPRILVTMDAGPFGFGELAAHAHCDALAVNIAVDGRPCIIDRGTYTYNGDPDARTNFRRTAAHNTVLLGGFEQALQAGPFLWKNRPDVRLETWNIEAHSAVATASCRLANGSFHRRTLIQQDDFVLVYDSTCSPNHVLSFLHFSPSIQATIHSRELLELRDEYTNTTICSIYCPGSNCILRKHWHSSAYGQRELAYSLEIHPAAPEFLTIIWPGGSNDLRYVCDTLATIAMSYGLDEAAHTLRKSDLPLREPKQPVY